MKCVLVFAAVLQATLASQVSVQLPYLNPAGVSYVGGPAAAPLAAAPFAPSAYSTSTYYGNGHFLGRLAPQQIAHHQLAAPLLAHQQQLAAPLLAHQHQLAAPVIAQHVAPAAALVPTVHHVPGVADVPVTRIQAQHGYIQKEVDVAHAAVKTNRFELRRPAIQKQFYDIEERVIVRPAGSALVELDQPHSKVHKSSVVSPFAPAHLAPAHLAPAHFTPALIGASPAPPALVSPIPPSFIPGPGFGISSTPNPIIDQGISSDDDSVVIEARRFPQPQIQQYQQQQQQQIQPQEQQLSQEYEVRSRIEQQPIQRTSLPLPAPSAQIAQHQPQPQLRSQLQPQLETQAVVRSRPELRLQDQSVNQQRLIELLTAREGVADVGFGSPTFRDIGDAGNVRARVLSAELAPRDAPVTGERVNTRRVVVSRPIETVEEVDVLEPVTKLERVAVQHPALFKTAHVGYERVPTSVPVLGKTIAPAVYSQAPLYYH